MKLLFTFFLFAISYNCFSQAGSLDKTFGHKGKVRTSVYGVCYASALQPDGKILVGGSNYTLIRYLPNGDLDSSFGKKGIVSVPVLSEIRGIQILPDSKIITAGTSLGNMAVVRFKENGDLDSSFGINGISIYGPGFGADAIQVQKNGKLLLAGYKIESAEGFLYDVMFMTRMNTDGSLDSGFNNGAGVVDHAGKEFTCVSIQKDGKIVVAGYSVLHKFLTRRYNANGSIDSSFGKQGIIITDIKGGGDGEDTPYDMSILKDGRILIAGVANYGGRKGSSMAVVNYNTDGTLHKAFGDSGITRVLFENKSAEATSLLVQQDGKLILSGYTFDKFSMLEADFALARLNTNGSIDSSFGINGKQISVFSGEDISTASLLQPDGKIILTGFIDVKGYFFLTRYNNNATAIERIIKPGKIENNLVIQVYPNPVKNVLNIKGLDAEMSYELSVMNGNGTLIAQTSINNTFSYKWNLQSLSKGVYYVIITSSLPAGRQGNNNKTTMKFVKE